MMGCIRLISLLDLLWKNNKKISMEWLNNLKKLKIYHWFNKFYIKNGEEEMLIGMEVLKYYEFIYQNKLII